MKEIVTFDTSFNKPSAQAIARSIVEKLNPIEIEDAPSGFALTFIFDHYPDEIDITRKQLKEHDISSSVWIRREYTTDELLEAEFLILDWEAVVSSLPGSLRWTERLVCSYCGFQESLWDFSQLRILNKAEGYQLAGVDWHPLVASVNLADFLRNSRFTGLELIPIDSGGVVMWYALKFNHTLPPLAVPPTRLQRTQNSTDQCSRDHNWGRLFSECYYHRREFSALDFNQTYELFGDSSMGSHRYMISNRVYRALRALGINSPGTEPVRLIE